MSHKNHIERYVIGSLWCKRFLILPTMAGLDVTENTEGNA